MTGEIAVSCKKVLWWFMTGRDDKYRWSAVFFFNYSALSGHFIRAPYTGSNLPVAKQICYHEQSVLAI